MTENKEKNHIFTQIYEVQTPAEAEALVGVGVDRIGGVILSADDWKSSDLKETVERTAALGAVSSLIPLFSGRDDVFRALDYYGPDVVHFCDALPRAADIAESRGEFLALQRGIRKRFPGIRVMRSLPIPLPGRADKEEIHDLARLFEPESDLFLTDTLLGDGPEAPVDGQPVKGFVGVTGKISDWDAARELVESRLRPVVLAGGLSADNVFDAILRVRPAGVDSCTGTNALDDMGRPVRFKKDLEKVKRFVAEVRRAELSLRTQNPELRTHQYRKENLMYESGDLRKGLKMELDGDPYAIVQFQFVKPGKGQALYKCKLKNMLTGVQFERTFRSGEKFKEADLEEQEMEYLYADSSGYCFMNTSNYEQLFLNEEQIGDARAFLKENTVCSVLLFKEQPIGLSLPNFIELKIVQADPWAKGDTASGDSKPAKLETGHTLQVPPFIEEGELIRIDTRTGEYVERVKNK
ncbi:MAG: elongation factor P [Desulfobacterales bacterium]|nr:elongation factor P [Desulfobacterales bacterium]